MKTDKLKILGYGLYLTIVPFDSNVENPDYKTELINNIIEEIR